DFWTQARCQPPLNAPEIGLGCCCVLLRGKEQRHIDRNASKGRFLYCRKPLLCAGDLDEQIGPGCLPVKLLCGSHTPRCIMSQKRRQLKRYPAINTLRCVMNGSEKICRL